MSIKSRFNLKILTIPLSILSLFSVLICYYLLQFVDLIVTADLYQFGLVFSYEWANQYWNYSNLIKNSILVSILITVIIIVFIIIQVLSSKTFIKSLISFLVIVKLFFISFSLFSLTRIDFIINNSLYDYGLLFSYDWAGIYWNNLVLIFGLILAVIIIDATSILILLAPGSRFNSAIRSLLRVNSLLFFIGIVILYLSIGFDSSVLSFVGLGCVFWGAILLYIHSSGYVKQDLLLTATTSSLESLRDIILELGYSGKPIYLPPKYLREFDSSKVFINKSSKTIFPIVNQLQDKTTIFIQKPQGLLITPPGSKLSTLLEKTLNTNFTQKDLSFIQKNIRRLIVEELEIAQNIEMEVNDSVVQVKIENSVYKNMGTLSSALACILAKTSGNIVIIENRETSKNGKIVYLDFRLFDSSQ